MVEKKNPCFECLGAVAMFLAKLERGVCPCHVLEREGLPFPKKEERGERISAIIKKGEKYGSKGLG